MNNILAIDSSTSVLRVGQMAIDGTVIERQNDDRFRHAEFIFQLIDEVLVESKIKKSSLDGLIVSIGPGSFTGLRVGLSSVKALALALEIPLVGISTFSAIAPRLFGEVGPCQMIIPSRRDEYYAGQIESEKFDNKNITIISTDELAPLAKKNRLLPIDCDLSKIIDDKSSIIQPDQFSLTIADYLNSGKSRLKAAVVDEISQLQPLYIQNFPAKSGK